MLDFRVDRGKCSGCGECVIECPVGIIEYSAELGMPVIRENEEEKCLGCEHCYAVCPQGAVSVFSLDPERDGVELTPGVLPTAEQMENLLRGRRSIRRYRQENVDREVLEKILRAVANCPTGVNNSALKFDVVADIGTMNRIRDKLTRDLMDCRERKGFPPALTYLEKVIEPCFEKGEDVVFRTAPHVLLVSASAENRVSTMVDVAIALSYFELLAQANGIGTAWCGILRLSMELFPDYRDILLSPDAGDYYCMLFGYPAVSFARTVKRDHVAKIRYLQST